LSREFLLKTPRLARPNLFAATTTTRITSGKDQQDTEGISVSFTGYYIRIQLVTELWIALSRVMSWIGVTDFFSSGQALQNLIISSEVRRAAGTPLTSPARLRNQSTCPT
jgi:hypothetical protein